MCILNILSYNEAMFIACEMERGAIRHYARAMQLLRTQGREQEPLYAQLVAMHRMEQEHLRRFSSFGDPSALSPERQTMLSALMQGWLFEGGLMGATRDGMMDDVPSMLAYARASEALSAAKYREFASLTDDPDCRDALFSIAAEEDQHLLDLSQPDQ